MPRDCNSSAMPRAVVIPERLISSTMPRRSAACWAALALTDAMASALPTCLPRSARAPLGLPSFLAARMRHLPPTRLGSKKVR